MKERTNGRTAFFPECHPNVNGGLTKAFFVLFSLGDGGVLESPVFVYIDRSFRSFSFIRCLYEEGDTKTKL